MAKDFVSRNAAINQWFSVVGWMRSKRASAAACRVQKYHDIDLASDARIVLFLLFYFFQSEPLTSRWRPDIRRFRMWSHRFRSSDRQPFHSCCSISDLCLVEFMNILSSLLIITVWCYGYIMYIFDVSICIRQAVNANTTQTIHRDVKLINDVCLCLDSLNHCAALGKIKKAWSARRCVIATSLANILPGNHIVWHALRLHCLKNVRLTQMRYLFWSSASVTGCYLYFSLAVTLGALSVLVSKLSLHFLSLHDWVDNQLFIVNVETIRTRIRLSTFNSAW